MHLRILRIIHRLQCTLHPRIDPCVTAISCALHLYVEREYTIEYLRVQYRKQYRF